MKDKIFALKVENFVTNYTFELYYYQKEGGMHVNEQLAGLDKKTLIEIIERRRDNIYKIAFAYMKNRYDADDIYQTVFENFLRSKPSFDSDDYEKAWFIRTTINACKNVFSSSWKKKVTTIEDEEWNRIPNQEHDQSDELLEKVMALPTKYRMVIHLFYYEGYSVNEIGQILNLSIGTVTTQLSRARKRLKSDIKVKWEAGVYGIKSFKL